MADDPVTAVAQAAATVAAVATPQGAAVTFGAWLLKHWYFPVILVLGLTIGGGTLYIKYKNAEYANVEKQLTDAQAANVESNKTIDKLNAAAALDRATTAEVVQKQTASTKAVAAVKKEQANEEGASVSAGAGWDALGDRLRTLSGNTNSN